MRSRGKYFLLVAGILYIAYGLFSLIAGTWVTLSEGLNGSNIHNMIHGLYALTIGIIGIVFSRNYYKHVLLTSLAVADIVWVIPMSLLVGNFLIILIYLPVPVLYIIGAQKNKLW